MAEITALNGGIAVSNSGKGNVELRVLNQAAKLPSVLSPLLIKIADRYQPSYAPNSVMEKSPEIETKIAFNRIRHYAEDIRVQSEFMAIIEESLSIIDDESPGSKGKILWTINRSYKEIKRQLLIDMNIDPLDSELVYNLIMDRSDYIFMRVLENIFETDCVGISCEREVLIAAQELLVCYGFIGCMILEEPQ